MKLLYLCRFSFLFVSVFAASHAMAQSSPKDPTRPVNLSPTEVEEQQVDDLTVRLEAILIRKNMKQAIVNGKSMSEGDIHLGVKVVLIKPKSIVVEQLINGDYEERELYVHPTGIIKTNATDNF